MEPEKWTCSANEALHIFIAEPSKAITFLPKFTYPIFGNSEQIFGYQGLRIDLAFDCLSLKPLLTWKYEKKLSEDIKPIEETMVQFLPTGDYVLKSESEWLDKIDEENFELPNENIVRSYERKGKKYDIYKFKLGEDTGNEDVGNKLHQRMQILTLLYIEAGSYIDLKDNGWELYVIYDRNKEEGKSIFVGFCTCYKYWKFEPSGVYDSYDDIEKEAKYRGRLSQIVIIPPYQGEGHGCEMYKHIADEWIRDDRCVEITIEDPNEEFDDLRDRCDLERMLHDGLLRDVKVFPLECENEERLLRQTKLTRRQFARVVEMALLWLVERGEGTWIAGLSVAQVRRAVKRRVYAANREGLAAIDAGEAKSKLEEVWRRVAVAYRDTGAVVAPAGKRRRDS